VPGVTMTPDEGLVHLVSGVAAIRSVLVQAELDAPVPACPAWDLRALAWHLGDIQRWVRGAIVEGHPNTETPPGPSVRADLLDWFDEGANALIDVLAHVDPAETCWTFGPHPRTAQFWFRRQAHEHAVHAHDAQASAGTTGGVDPQLALDGIDEVVSMFFPRQVRLHRTAALAGSLGLRPTDGDGAAWVLAVDGATDRLPAPPQAVVSGPAEALYLLLWRRIGVTDARLSLEGDPAAARTVLGAALVP
jgi:uncharacterized protein (TIGR03083 family)